MSDMLFGFLGQSICMRLTQTLLHFLWQGLVIGLCAFVLAWMGRTATARFRYGIHTISLGLMALCFPITFALIPSTDPVQTERRFIRSNENSTSVDLDARQSSTGLIRADSEAETSVAKQTIPPHVELSNGAVDVLVEPMNAEPISVISHPKFISVIREIAPYAVCVYAFGVIAMMVRLCCALWGGHRLRQVAVPIENPQLLQRIRSHASRIGLRMVPVVAYCERIAIPVVAGIIRPVVLLPLWMTTDMDPEQVLVILAHEMAHIRRFDLIVNLLQRILETVLFFHPAVWYVSRQLSFERENCCDDAVVRSGFGSLQYASTLVRLAELCATKYPSHSSTKLATLAADGGRQGQLKLRIMRLLNGEQRLRLTRLDSATIMLMAAIIIGTMAGAWHQSSAAAGLGTTATKDAADAKKRLEEAKIEVEYVGKVVDADDKPVAGAEIWCTTNGRRIIGDEVESNVRQVAVSDRNGEFAFQLDTQEEVGLDSTWWNTGRLAARADDHACDWLPLPIFEKNPIRSVDRENFKKSVDLKLGDGRFASKTLKLQQEAGPIQGRLVDLEGRPLAGVVISVENIQNMDFAEMVQGFEKQSSDTINRFLHERTPPGCWLTRRDCQSLIRPATTNANGEFTLRGLGQDQMCTVALSHERVDAETIFILGREMQTMRVPHISFYPNGAKNVYVGLHFSHAVGPAIPVSGVVTEYQSGKPIAHATVFVDRLFGREGMSTNIQLRLPRHIRTVTDEQGRYRLVGIPPGPGHVLEVIAPTSEPWLMASHEFSLDSNEQDATINLQVYRGIWLEGRVTDATSSDPIRGRVDYLALRSNLNTPKNFGLKEGWRMNRFPIDESGRYRTAGLPGPGLLLVRSYGQMPYPLSVGADKIEEYDPKSDYLPTTPIGLPLSNWHRIEKIDPAVDSKSHSIDLTLSAGLTVTGRVLEPDDSPASTLQVIGQVYKDGFFEPLLDETFKVYDYDPNVPRSLFFKNVDNSLVGHVELKGPPPADLKVHLQPAVTVRGRVIESDTDDIATGYTIFCGSSKQGAFRIDDDKTTDRDGRFEIKGLMAGNVYKMMTANRGRSSGGKNNFSIDLTAAKPGDVIDLGDVTGKNAKKTK